MIVGIRNKIIFHVFFLMEMERFSPKIEIIDHFDNLINRVDIDIDSSLEIYNNEQLFSDLLRTYRQFPPNGSFFVKRYSLPSEIELDDDESVKVVNYLQTIRMETIEELRKAPEETLQCYSRIHRVSKMNSSI